MHSVEAERQNINEAVGWWSQGPSQAECENLLSKLPKNWRSGQGPQTLKEMRETAAMDKMEEQHQQRLKKSENITLAQFWEDKYYPNIQLYKSLNSARTEQLLFNKWLHQRKAAIDPATIIFQLERLNLL